MHEFSTVQLHISADNVASVWLNRPDKNNAFNALMLDELQEAFHRVSQQPGLRFMFLRGHGRHFSAGADLAWMQASARLSYAENLAEAVRLNELMAQLQHLPLPTVAVVQGAAFAGAMGLVSCCDMAIAADDALFSLSEVRLGLAPAVISPYVVQAIGPRAARRYALTAERFDALRARELGLLDEVYPRAELEAAVQTWTRRLLGNGPEAMRACKALLLEIGDGQPTASRQAQAQALIARLRTGTEGQEGMQAFFDKRAPAWTEVMP
ncbi:enoyl-CoA hydratase-related protein [Pseudomonas rhizosphaerae]|uniref:enoyl-CoA hydratase-related protein n=1 Tax=Pseudomonas rhizosphaerae TaxID=216142 RepID=UPI00177E69B5|nr:enoyl-CoA hydratase-related protein [Pseudomonas rhizosphaerae]MBD8612361.1 enoyl-CoA hydratase/isomerase family protein [Pseudomonas putida]MEB2869338.1 enoyl-CoA hydratase-related protein [Pseudomonas rhizosphaerae]